jgi:hypothetical protein
MFNTIAGNYFPISIIYPTVMYSGVAIFYRDFAIVFPSSFSFVIFDKIAAAAKISTTFNDL